MKDDRVDDLGPLATKLLEAERRRPEEVADVSARLLARVTASVAVGSVGAAAARAAEGATGEAAGTAGKVAAGTAAPGAAASLGLTAKALPWIAVAFVAGGGTGAALHAGLAAPPDAPAVPVVTPARPAALSGAPSSAEPELAPSAVVTVSPVEPHVPVGPDDPRPSATPRTPPPNPRAAAPASSGDAELASERALVDRARSALLSGHPSEALEAVDAHARRFPRGRLAEEREALAVQALARAGERAQAKVRAEAFRRAYPESLFIEAVERAAP